jgi:hypothetical protein
MVLRGALARGAIHRAAGFGVRSDLDGGPVPIREGSYDVCDERGFPDFAALASYGQQEAGKWGWGATCGHYLDFVDLFLSIVFLPIIVSAIIDPTWSMSASRATLFPVCGSAPPIPADARTRRTVL